MKDVLLTIKGSQVIDEQFADDVMEIVTEGTMDGGDGKYLITYYNSDDDYGTDKTELRIDGERMAVLKRTGATGGRIIVERGRRHLCHYAVPEGDIMIGVFGQSIRNSVTDAGGDITLSYTIDVNMGLLSKNTVDISVRVVD